MQSASTCDSAVKHCLAFVCVRESPSGLVVWVFVTGADSDARLCFGCGCKIILSIIIIDNFCIPLFSGVYKLTALYNTLQHFIS